VAVLLIWLALAVPLVEEIAFRGALLGGLQRYVSFGWADLIQAVAFASLHEAVVLFPFYVALALVAG
jgi:membrane protease YdiL (CAAX protease family)